MEKRGIVVIGAGIAGASVAAELAGSGQDVVLLEREMAPGYHTTGRSAALYAPSYGPVVIRALTRASRAAFQAPPTSGRPHPLLKPRGVLVQARRDQGPRAAPPCKGAHCALRTAHCARARAW
ncbi:FAD-dependent oxidoreductase, partial [Pararhodobacter marinus]|uniref:FAD-dependent oxidoreductase n=1 Tax=Pararhodobacter marinus TaxID=2184063 RepID=UPI003513BF22